MNIFIDNGCGAHIYDQIYSQIKQLIISDNLRENEPLPSIRSLARDLRISVITTKRAYDELEKEGFIYTVAGKGCFVAKKNTELIREENLKRLEALICEVLELAESCNLTYSDVLEIIDFRRTENERIGNK